MNKNKVLKIGKLLVKILVIIAVITFCSFIAILIISKVREKKEIQKINYNDGPYVFYLNDSTAQIITVHDCRIANIDKVKFEIKSQDISYSSIKNDTVNILFDHWQTCDTLDFNENEFTASKIAVISDIHGSYNHFKQLLINNKIINDSLNWTYQDGHLVIVGDVIDKGPGVTDCLWLIKKLEKQAENCAGKVHFLLGNHELSLLLGQDKYFDYKYHSICWELSKNYNELFVENTELGRWLRTKSIIVKINEILFVHGGISEKIIDNNLSIYDLNKYTKMYLSTSNLATYNQIDGDKIRLITSLIGPLEYRGYFNMNIFNRGVSNLKINVINRIKEYYKCNRIIVGHTIVKNIKPLFNYSIIAIDLKMPEDDILSNKNIVQMLLIEGDSYYRGFSERKKVLLFNAKEKFKNTK